MSEKKPPAEKTAEKWSSKCEAYKKVYKGFRNGTYNANSYKPKDVWLDDPIYQKYDLTRFRSNIGRIAMAYIKGIINNNFFFNQFV